ELEDRDEPGRLLEVGLVLVGAERSQVLEPARARAAAIELPLLLLGRGADLALELGILHADEAPGLLVRARRRAARRAHEPLDRLARDGPVAEGAHRAAPGEDLAGLARGLLGGRRGHVAIEVGDEAGLG